MYLTLVYGKINHRPRTQLKHKEHPAPLCMLKPYSAAAILIKMSLILGGIDVMPSAKTSTAFKL